MAHAHAQSHFEAVKITCDTCVIHLTICAIAALARTKKTRSFRHGKLKASRATVTEDRGTKGRG